jgi:hypothetical protein
MFVEVEPESRGSTASLWLSTYGLDDARAAALHARVDRLYREALGLVDAEAPVDELAPAERPAPHDAELTGADQVKSWKPEARS